MESPYNSRYPVAPNPTPRTSTSVKPPIYNPYDKFTQPQFDDWIGSITSALRKALGQEEDAQIGARKDGVGYVNATRGATREDGEEVDDTVEDSFADLKARREKVLGKRRAVQDYDEYQSDAEEFGRVAAQNHGLGSSPGHAIELSSSGGEDELLEEDDADEESSVRDLIRDYTPESDANWQSSPGVAKPAFKPTVNEEHQDVCDLRSDIPSDEDEESVPSQSPDIYTRQSAPNEHVEDFYAGGDPADLEAPQVLSSYLTPDFESDTQQPPDIRDPWSFPKEYCEDLYTGGDITSTDGAALSPSHLTPNEDNDIEYTSQAHQMPSNGQLLQYFSQQSPLDEQDDDLGTKTSINIKKGKVRASSSFDEREDVVQNGRRDTYADDLECDELMEDYMDRKAAPESDNFAIRERLEGHSMHTPSSRQSSPTFALNDRVDWGTPSFDGRVSHATMVHDDDGESGSEISSGENEVETLSISDGDEENYHERISESPLPSETSDLDVDAQDGDDELEEYEEDEDSAADPNFYGCHRISQAAPASNDEERRKFISFTDHDTDVSAEVKQLIQSIAQEARTGPESDIKMFGLDGQRDLTNDREIFERQPTEFDGREMSSPLVLHSNMIVSTSVSEPISHPIQQARPLPVSDPSAEGTQIQQAASVKEESPLVELSGVPDEITTDVVHDRAEHKTVAKNHNIFATLQSVIVLPTKQDGQPPKPVAEASDGAVAEEPGMAIDFNDTAEALDQGQEGFMSVTPLSHISDAGVAQTDLSKTETDVICESSATLGMTNPATLLDIFVDEQETSITSPYHVDDLSEKAQESMVDDSWQTEPTVDVSVATQEEPSVDTPSSRFQSIEDVEYLVTESGSPRLSKNEIRTEVLLIQGSETDENIQNFVEEPATEGRETEEPDIVHVSTSNDQQSHVNSNVEMANPRPMSPMLSDDQKGSITQTSPHRDPNLLSSETTKISHFVMPIVANPNVRDPTSVVHTPVASVSSQPDTPQSDVASLPVAAAAIATFTSDNHLSTDDSHSASGLFTPLEGEDGSVAPSSSASDVIEMELQNDIPCAESISKTVEASSEDETPIDSTGIEASSDPLDNLGIPTPIDRPKVDTTNGTIEVTHDGRPDESHDLTASSPCMLKLAELPEISPELAPTNLEDPGGAAGAGDDLAALQLSHPASDIVSNHDEKCHTEASCIDNIMPPVEDEIFHAEGIPDPQFFVAVGDLDLGTQLEAAKRNDPIGDVGDMEPIQVVPEAEEHTSLAEAKKQAEQEDDPFKLMGNDSIVAPGLVDTDESESAFSSSTSNEEAKMSEYDPLIAHAFPPLTHVVSSTEELDSVQNLEVTPGNQISAAIASPTSSDTVEAVKRLDCQLSDGSSMTALADGPSSIQDDKPKALKRKRSPSVQGSAALIRSVSQGKLRTYGRRSLDKGNTARREGNGSKIELVHNDASGTQKFAPPQAIPHTLSVAVESITRTDGNLPMLHGHGKFKKIGQPLQLQRKLQEPSKQAAVSRLEVGGILEKDSKPHTPPPSLKLIVPPREPTPPAVSPIPPSPTPPLSLTSSLEFGPPFRPSPTKSVSRPSTSPISPPQPSPSSPSISNRTPQSRSTRSQCRYRKISLPEDDDKPRITFCVPQCSLNDKDHMEENQITDDGAATQNDYEACFEHVETLNFDACLLGVLRLLVGVDLLRENEVYYLPKPGEVVWRRTTKGVLKQATRTSFIEESAVYSPTTTSSVAGPSGNRSTAPTSAVESTSTASSSLRHESNWSISDNEGTDRGNVPPAKRRKRNHKTHTGNRNSALASPSVGRNSQRIFRKGLSHDAQKFKPELESNEEEVPKIQRRKSVRQGLKRNRTTDDAKTEESASSPLKGSGGKTKKAKLARQDIHDDS